MSKLQNIRIHEKLSHEHEAAMKKIRAELDQVMLVFFPSSPFFFAHADYWMFLQAGQGRSSYHLH